MTRRQTRAARRVGSRLADGRGRTGDEPTSFRGGRGHEAVRPAHQRREVENPRLVEHVRVVEGHGEAHVRRVGGQEFRPAPDQLRRVPDGVATFEVRVHPGPQVAFRVLELRLVLQFLSHDPGLAADDEELPDRRVSRHLASVSVEGQPRSRFSDVVSPWQQLVQRYSWIGGQAHLDLKEVQVGRRSLFRPQSSWCLGRFVPGRHLGPVFDGAGLPELVRTRKRDVDSDCCRVGSSGPVVLDNGGWLLKQSDLLDVQDRRCLQNPTSSLMLKPELVRSRDIIRSPLFSEGPEDCQRIRGQGSPRLVETSEKRPKPCRHLDLNSPCTVFAENFEQEDGL